MFKNRGVTERARGMMHKVVIQSVGTSGILKFVLYSNWYYNQKKIYWEFIHLKYMLCHISGITLGLSGSGGKQGILIIASGNHFY